MSTQTIAQTTTQSTTATDPTDLTTAQSTTQPTAPNWEQLLEVARSRTPARRVRRPGQSPSSAPISSSLDRLSADARPPVLLYRDTNSWCPFCERVWFALEEKGIPFETEFIDLSNKPKWYTDLVPTTLVPAATINGKLIYESKDILLALEERFGATLLPENPEENAIARQWIELAETNGFRDIAYKFLRENFANDTELEAVKAEFERQLDELEQALGQYSGPYFVSTFSIVDIMYSPHLDRLAANLPIYRGYRIQGNPRFPRLNAWFEALNQRSAYHRVRSDATTNNLLLRRRFGKQPIANPLPSSATNHHTDSIADNSEIQNRAEAAERLSDNHEAAIGDIWRNSGVSAFEQGGNEATVQDAIDLHLRLLANDLLYPEQTVLVGGRIGGKDHADPVVSAIGAIVLAYIRNRICAPRDMSAGAATALRQAADRLLVTLY